MRLILDYQNERPRVLLQCKCGEILQEDFDGSGGLLCSKCGRRISAWDTIQHARLAHMAVSETLAGLLDCCLGDSLFLAVASMPPLVQVPRYGSNGDPARNSQRHQPA
jgi:hypothetical protein